MKNCLVWLLLLGLVACQPALRPASRSPALVAVAPGDQPSPSPQMVQASPTPVVAQDLEMVVNTPSPATPPPLVAADPFVFTFPTTQAEPISSWRPPLYPVPWEPTPHDHFYLTRPIGANEVNWPLARYRYGGMFYSEPHTGIDIPAPKGTPVLAAGPGTVIWAGYGLYFLREEYRDPYGIAVAIQHDFGYQGQNLYTVYAHMDECYVIQGQRVEGGEMIGLVGETGRVSGPHLHFEVRIGDSSTYFVSRNPELWIAPPEGWGVLAGRVMANDGDLVYQQKMNLHHLDSGRLFTVDTYGRGAVNSDSYYQENVVIGDLPPGKYSLWTEYAGKILRTEMEIHPGMVTYFTMLGTQGFFFNPPRNSGVRFIPPDATATVLP